jgi:enterochelin esterase-like enzyme
MPSPTPPGCWQEGGVIATGQVQTEQLPLPLDFRVYLPPCYQEQRERRYPVLYLIHGQSFNDDQWDRLGADETADRLIAEGQVSPFMIVLPRDRVWSQPTEDMFGQAVVQALVPWIDQNYRTLTERQYRAVGGLSRGAGWALHLGFSQWELFGSIGMHSLPVFWTDLPDIKPWLDALMPDLLPRIYMDIGEKDRPQIMKSALWFESLLTEKGIPHEWHLYPGYHEEAYWEAHMEEYLRWYAENW